MDGRMKKDYDEDGVVIDRDRTRQYYSSAVYARAAERLKGLERQWVGKKVKYWGAFYTVHGIVSPALDLAARALIVPVDVDEADVYAWKSRERLVQFSQLVLVE